MHVLGVDIGGSGIKGAIVDTNTGELISQRCRVKTPQPSTPEAIANSLKELVDLIGYKGPLACGFPARVENGVVLTAANIDKSWINIKVEELFSKVLNTKVFVANDADVAGVAEMHFGDGKKYLKHGKVAFLTLGTGIGSALFVNGQLYEGTEFGHILFKNDSAERYCSEAVKERENLKWTQWGDRFNEYLNHLDFIIKPDIFILGGGGSKKFDKFACRLDLIDKVRPAKTLNLAGIIGAAMYCEDRAHQA